MGARSLVGRIVVLLFLLFAAIYAIAFFAVTGSATVGPVAVPLLFAAGIMMGGAVGVAAHEGGHFLCAAASSIPVRSLSVGRGPPLLRVRIGETSLELRQEFWAGGTVVPYPTLMSHKYATMFFMIGGVLGNIALLALVIGLSEAFAVPFYLGLVLSGAAFAQLVMIAVNLFPRNLKIDGETLGSDGRQLWQTLCNSASGRTQQGLFFAAMLHLYGGGEEPAVSPAAPRLCYHLSRERWTNEVVRREVDDAFLRELGRGGLTREEELLVLDALSTDTLLFGDPALRAHLDAWSLRALTLAPAIRTVRGTRGGVLVELGRHAEAKPFLEPLTQAEETSLDRVLGHAFLARAEHALGETAAARRHASEARRICSATARPPAITSFVERIEAEVGAL
jgi:hypothetical protein